VIKLKEISKITTRYTNRLNEAPEQHEVYEAIQSVADAVDEMENGIDDLNRINFESKDKPLAKRIVNDFKIFRKRVNKFYDDVDRGKIKTTEF
tara:strand:+ start:427 stop:705 length:279 start_codon:yes stop_codon:yes gene_type:complete